MTEGVKRIAVVPGDGIGPEVIEEAVGDVVLASLPRIEEKIKGGRGEAKGETSKQ